MKITNHDLLLTNVEIVILERAMLVIMNDDALIKRLCHSKNVDFTKEIIEGIYKKAYEIDSKLD